MRYAPEGVRRLGLGTAHNDFIVPQVPDYLAEANRQNIAMCQIESAMALDNLTAIASTPGVDVLFVGDFDLMQSMGIVGQFDSARFTGALERVVAAASANGKFAGIQPASVTQARHAVSMGYRVISMGHDTGVYGNALRSMAQEVRDI